MSSELNFSDKFKKIAALRHSALFKFDLFDRATEGAISELKSELEEGLDRIQVMGTAVPEVNESNYRTVSDEEWRLIDQYTQKHAQAEAAKEHLLSLLEMKIIYLFKSLEVVMKRMIQIAYPKTNTKDLYQWDNMKAFFKYREIDLSTLNGYRECTDLRKVNNSIKHNGIINDEIRQIREFVNKTEYEFVDLEALYRRVRPKVEAFSTELRNRIEEDLFAFSYKRLQDLAQGYNERMDHITLRTFIAILKLNLPAQSEEGNDMTDDLPF